MPEDTAIEFQLLTGCLGYRTKEDETNLVESLQSDAYLVAGSKNFLINSSGDKVISRNGYAVFGDESETRTPYKSEHTWLNSNGEEILIVEANGTLEFYSEESEQYEELMTGLSATYQVRFAEIWDGTELLDKLLFVNHAADLYEWSGGMATLAAGGVAAGTITINEVIAESHFLTAGTRSIRIKDDNGVWRETVYTNQVGSVFTVSSDLTGFPFSGGNLVVQKVRTNASAISSSYILDQIGVQDNQVYLGSQGSRDHYISKNTSITDYSFSSPRLPGEGAKLILDDVNIGFKVGRNEQGEESMNIFCGQDFVYRVKFELTAGSTSDRELVFVKPLIFAARQGARSQELIGKTPNDIVFVNWENELVELGQLENLSTQEAVPISDPIKPDFKAADFAGGGHIAFDDNSILVSVKSQSIVFVFDVQNKYWQPPQELPIWMFSRYDGELLAHSNQVKESYTLFTGFSDRQVNGEAGSAFTARARFAYRNHGTRTKRKNFDRYYHELYVTSNLEVVHTCYFEYGGAKGVVPKTMLGSEQTFRFAPDLNASIGVNSLGVPPLASSLSAAPELYKYRRFRPHEPIDYFEFQSEYVADILDSQIQIVAHGPNAQVSANEPPKLVA